MKLLVTRYFEPSLTSYDFVFEITIFISYYGMDWCTTLYFLIILVLEDTSIFLSLLS